MDLRSRQPDPPRRNGDPPARNEDPPPRDPDEGEAVRSRRRRLVERDIAGSGVSDPRVLSAMARVPRHPFVPERYRDIAYRDRPFPIGAGQVITQPSLVARMVAAAEVGPEDRVLEIGTGSGYGAAVLAELAAEVHTVERREEFVESARRRLRELGYDNVHVQLADGTQGWPEASPFDAVVCTAGGPRIPDPLLDQLVPGRWLVIPLGPRPRLQTLYRVRVVEGRLEREDLGPVRFVPLVGEEGWSAEDV